MASNKDNLNFEDALQLIFQSDFKCIFCGKFCLDFYSNETSVEHVLNQNCDRKDVRFMALSHNLCNSRYKDLEKPYNVEKQIEKNKIRVTETAKYSIIKILVEHSPAFALYMPKNIAEQNGMSYSARRNINAKQYALKVLAENELKQDAKYLELQEIKKQAQIAENKRISEQMESIF